MPCRYQPGFGLYSWKAQSRLPWGARTVSGRFLYYFGSLDGDPDGVDLGGLGITASLLWRPGA